jgi:histo-blood group ABO system transferase
MGVVGIAVIACGDSYFDYSQQLIKTLDSKVHFSKTIRVYIMTDKQNIKVNVPSNLEVRYISIPKLDWPEATLLRYELISKHLSSEDLTHIFYMDADLEVIDEIDDSDIPFDSNFFCVAHPGYYNRGLLFNLIKKIYFPPWETSPRFSCSIPFFKRSTYVAGGFWGGRKQEILRMCDILSTHTNRDRGLGLYPRSYDESYLNWWVAKNLECVVLTPIFLYAEQFPWLANLQKPRILAVTKSKVISDHKFQRDGIYKGRAKNRF